MVFLYILLFVAAFTAKGSAECYKSNYTMCSDSTCLGVCDAQNGCLCIDQTTTCLPNGTHCQEKPYKSCCPIGLFWSTTEKCCTKTLECNPPCYADEICKDVGGIGTCSCNTTVYARMNTSAIRPSVSCESDSIDISFEECLLISLGFDPVNITLPEISENCTFLYSSEKNGVKVVNLQSRPKAGWCNTAVTSDNVNAYFTNTLLLGILNKPVITVNPIKVSFTCSYNLTMQTSLAAALRPVLSTAILTMDGATGSVITTMAAYWDSSYANPIKENEEVEVGKRFYLGIFVDSLDVDTFLLRAENCFSTPDGNANNVNRVELVVGGCAAGQGVDVDVQQNGNGSEARIQIGAFVFKDQPQVFITCNLRLCPKNATCQGCNVGRSSENGGSGSVTIPVNFLLLDSNSATNTVLSWVLLASSLLTVFAIKNM